MFPLDRAIYSPAAVDWITIRSVCARQCTRAPCTHIIRALVDCRVSVCPARSMSVLHITFIVSPACLCSSVGCLSSSCVMSSVMLYVEVS